MFFSFQVRLYSELNKIEGSLRELQRLNHQKDSQTYSIEVLELIWIWNELLTHLFFDSFYDKDVLALHIGDVKSCFLHRRSTVTLVATWEL